MSNQQNTDIAAMQQTLNRMREQLQQATQQQQSMVFEVCRAFQRHGIASPNANYAGNKNLHGLLLQLDNYFAGGQDMAGREEPERPLPPPEDPDQAAINAAIMEQLADIRAQLQGGDDVER